jgi:hypothetical protein
VPVVYVCGNHEAYGARYSETIKALTLQAQGTNVRFLEHDSIELGDLRILGCCLWTDYRLYGDRFRSMKYSRDVMSDHRSILRDDGTAFEPEEALAEHLRAIEWLADELAKPFSGKTVVVTHHGVSPDSIHPRFRNHPVNPGFVSDLRYMLPFGDVWIHGHVHDSFDYWSGSVRVVANPRGYPVNLASARVESDLQWENSRYDPCCVLEI